MCADFQRGWGIRTISSSLSAGVLVPLGKSYPFFPLLEFCCLAVITFFLIFAPFCQTMDDILGQVQTQSFCPDSMCAQTK